MFEFDEQSLFTYRTKNKIGTLEEVKRWVGGWRVRGDSIVFTNGCFDLLHPGHIFILEEAAALGDHLVVAINSDQSVSHLKGSQRPIWNAADRAQMVAALEFVDAVFLFDEETPLNAILTLKPDVLVKGGDYTEETIVGAKEVKEWGGKVVTIPLKEGYSTTALIRKIQSLPAS
jgi:D-beta-D-heptose 7-phosphate kinase/D-beta-D-heptose 1-phosphate adenosyltransferase